MELTRKEIKVGPIVHRLDRMLYRNMSAHIKGAGIEELSPMHRWILRYLYENREKDVFQRDIEKKFAIGRSSVTNTIQVMERGGYLERRSVEKDARLKKVVITRQGIEVQEAVEHLLDQLNEQLLSGISEEKLQAFLEVVEQLEKNIKYHVDRPWEEDVKR